MEAASQQIHGTQRRAANCSANAPAKAMPPKATAITRGSRCTRWSELDSPIPVVTQGIQKATVTAGTLTSVCRGP